MKSIGIVATSADKAILLKGSITCVQFIKTNSAVRNNFWCLNVCYKYLPALKNNPLSHSLGLPSNVNLIFPSS